MIRQRMMTRLAVLFLLLGTTMAWSKRMHKPKSAVQGSQVAPAESKVHPRYSEDPKAAESSYILDEDHSYPKGHGHSEEYVDSEDKKSVKEQDEAQGNLESDDTVKDDEYNEHSEKGGFKELKAGGLSYDKHLKDHKADNKEVENVKQHDMGSKFGGEATKEHKLGKHKEKSKGHKLHGFKNVYHKEEYGDHKTFHDEFLDSDHQHNYDDHHEHQEVQGGKFSKGFKHEGKNNKFDKGDEKHEFGKEEFDANHEGKHEKGGNKSKHRHATKKHQGHYDSNAERKKNSVHKIQKGIPPPPPSYPAHVGHHGPHQAQIQPYVSHYNSHHEQVNIPSHSYKPHAHQQSHQVPYDGDKHSSSGDHGSTYHGHDGHHGNHGSHHHNHGGHHGNDNSDEYYSKDNGHDSDYHERTAQSHPQRSSGKDELEDKSGEKFAPVVKHEPVARKPEHIVHKHEPIVRSHEPYAFKHQPHTHHHQSHAHKQSVSPNYGIQQYRQPVYQDNSNFRPSQPLRHDKFSERFNDRSNNHNHGIRYGFQPRNHNHHHHNQNSRFNHNFDSRHQQPFPRFQGFNHQHQANHKAHGHHHHHHGAHKNHSHFRHTPSHFQQESKPEIYSPKVEDTPVKPTGNEGHHKISQKHYE